MDQPPAIPQKNEIIVYQPDETIRLEVRLENETVWLTQNRLGTLFDVDRSVISRHIRKIYNSGELAEEATCAKIAQVHLEGTRAITRLQPYYNLDVIIAVGYRVNSIRATQFRIWATKVLKQYLLRGYAVNDRLERLETKVARHDEQIGVLLKTALPPVEGVLFEGQICDAYSTAMKLLKSAQKSLVLIDNYIDESVLTMLGARGEGVPATIYTRKCTAKLRLDVQKYNAQYPPIAIRACRGVHDRFLLIDDAVTYHVGASLKDLGKSLFAFSRLEIPPQELLARI